MATGRLNAFVKTRTFRHGVPFVMLVVGGSFGLKEFTSARYIFRKQGIMSREAEEQLDVKAKQESLEDIYEKTRKKVDIDNWSNIRGPRPWENSREMQAEQRKALAIKNSLIAGLNEKAQAENKK